MTDYEIRNATREEITNLFGGSYRAIRAYSIYYKGEYVAMSGVLIRPDALFGFYDIKEGVVAPKITYMRCAREMMAKLTRSGAPMVAIPEPGFPNAGKFLRLLGWVEIDGGRYLWQP